MISTYFALRSMNRFDMMLQKYYLFLGIGLLVGLNTFSQSAVNTWKSYLNYSNAIDLDKLGNDVYVAADNTVFIYHQDDNSFDLLDGISGLSDVGISLIRINQELGIALIGYENGNIDIIDGHTITNYSEIKNSAVVGDKAIRHVTFTENTAYLSTGVGILNFDLERLEIKDTYNVTSEGATSAYETAILNDTLFVATSEGLYAGSLAQDLTIFSNWNQDLTIPDPFGEVTHCANFEGDLFISLPDALPAGLYKREENGMWNNILEISGIKSLRSEFGYLSTTTGWFSKVWSADGSETSFGNYGPTSASARGIIVDESGTILIADNRSGLVKRYSENSYEFIYPDGPGTNSAFDIDFKKGVLWVASGSPRRPGTWSNTFKPGGFYNLKNGSWFNFTTASHPRISEDVFIDVCKVYIDPDDENKAYVGSLFSGAYEVINNEIVEWYRNDNSSLSDFTNYERSDGEPWIGVTGFVKDDDKNLWVSNLNANEPLSMRNAEGVWESFDMNGVLGGNRQVLDIITDQNGYLWIIVNGSGGLAVVNPKAGNGGMEYARLTASIGSGGLASNEVYAINTDLDGELWVGTSNGISVFYSPFDIFSDQPSDSRQILVEQDGNFQYLLEGQSVSSIAIDGANRKWIGTFGSGVFLMSEDGTEEIRRFTTSNSPLISNVVNDIVIDQNTGEVFMATNEGIVSFMSDASEGQLENNCSSVYPNPVRENYNGPISITGLMRDSEVRISDAGGNLVYEMISNGGTAIWDGRNIDGVRVATGVYFALVADAESGSKCVSKILVVK